MLAFILTWSFSMSFGDFIFTILGLVVEALNFIPNEDAVVSAAREVSVPPNDPPH
jgi:hypothetical protein